MASLKHMWNLMRRYTHDISNELDRIERARQEVWGHKIIREDQLHGAFLEDPDSPYAKYFAQTHRQAIASMRTMQAHGYASGAQRDIEFDNPNNDFGFFPEAETQVQAQEDPSVQEAGKMIGLNIKGALKSVYSESDQKPVFKYARLGDWLKTWENFTPVSNLHAVARECALDGKTDKALEFWGRIKGLPDHGETLEFGHEIAKGSSWPDVHDPDAGPEPEVELDQR